MTAERENVGRRLRGLVEIARTQDVEDGNGLADRAWLFATASDVSDFVAALDARLAAAETALADVGNLSDEWEHSAELEVGRRQDDSNAKVAVYRICARELRAAVSGLSFIDERILQAHANDEIVREFFSGHVWIVRWRDRGKRGHRDPAYRYTLFVNGILESIGEFSERAAVHAARANRAFLLQRDGVR